MSERISVVAPEKAAKEAAAKNLEAAEARIAELQAVRAELTEELEGPDYKGRALARLALDELSKDFENARRVLQLRQEAVDKFDISTTLAERAASAVAGMTPEDVSIIVIAGKAPAANAKKCPVVYVVALEPGRIEVIADVPDRWKELLDTDRLISALEQNDVAFGGTPVLRSASHTVGNVLRQVVTSPKPLAMMPEGSWMRAEAEAAFEAGKVDADFLRRINQGSMPGPGATVYL
jgi:hypothetical protein